MPASWQMQKDSQLIDNLANQQRPLVRFYEWESPTITYGYFINPEDHLVNHISGFDLARRPTGGGILFHANDWTFTVAIPRSHPKFSQNVLENYRLINEAVLEAICETVSSMSERPTIALQKEEPLLSMRAFCMAAATKYDLLLDGLKIGGSAQRKTQFGFVHQASVFLSQPDWESLEGSLQNGKELVHAMKLTSSYLGKVSRETLSNALIRSLESSLQ